MNWCSSDRIISSDCHLMFSVAQATAMHFVSQFFINVHVRIYLFTTKMCCFYHALLMAVRVKVMYHCHLYA